jgi:hypothetical protein
MKPTNEPLPLLRWLCQLRLGIRWIHHRMPRAWPGQPIRTNALGSADSRWILGDGEPTASFALPNVRGKRHTTAGCAGRVVLRDHGRRGQCGLPLRVGLTEGLGGAGLSMRLLRRNNHYETPEQPSGLKIRCVEAGYLCNFEAGRRGRGTSSPPKFGQALFNFCSANFAQNVHSNVQMRASSLSGGRSRSQHSQLGLSSSMAASISVGLLQVDCSARAYGIVMPSSFRRWQLCSNAA